MKILLNFIKTIYIDKKGGSASEYAIMVALIAVGVIGALIIVGAVLIRLFEFEFPTVP